MATRSKKVGSNVQSHSKADLLALYKRMAIIRKAELRLGRLFADGEVPGFIHLSVGQEAVAAAIGTLLTDSDTVASTHRGHGHALAKGISLDNLFFEIMARDEGICRGRGGSMHVANFDLGMLGANAIVGASIPIALGSAMAHKVRGSDAVAVAFFGDGAMAEGVLHESLNMASLWQLPLLFVCENNGWAEFSPTHKQFVASLEDLAGAFHLPHKKVDGNKAVEVLEAADQAFKDIRAGQGPFVLECITHRWRGHYEGDPQKYRSAQEMDSLDQKDPLRLFESVLLDGGVKQPEIAALLAVVDHEVEGSVERARNGAMPMWDEACADVYAPLNEANHG